MKMPVRAAVLVLLLGVSAWALAAEPAPPAPGYTLAQIFAEPGLTGYSPEQIEWSPDGRYLSYLLRSGPGGLANLYIVNVADDRASLLLTAQQLGGAATPPSAIKTRSNRSASRVTALPVITGRPRVMRFSISTTIRFTCIT